jgi:hypothetical protein
MASKGDIQATRSTAAAPAAVVNSVIRLVVSAAPAPDNSCTPPLIAFP